MTDFDKIERHARALMTAHGVGSLGFEFDRGKKRLGATRFVKIGNTHLPKRITLSRHFIEAGLTEDEIYNVVLHEIAHAKAGFSAGHGPVWQKHARALGIKPERCASPSVTVNKAWLAYCPNCNQQRGAQHRAPLRVYACGGADCKALPFAERVLNWYQNGQPVVAQSMPVRYYAEYQRIMSKRLV